VLANRIPQEIGGDDDDTLRLVLDNLHAAHRDMWDEFRDDGGSQQRVQLY